MHIVHITRTLAVGLVLVLTATGLWAAGGEEEERRQRRWRKRWCATPPPARW